MLTQSEKVMGRTVEYSRAGFAGGVELLGDMPLGMHQGHLLPRRIEKFADRGWERCAVVSLVRHTISVDA